MRVALVHSFYSSGAPSGENSVVNDQLEMLRDAGHEVLLVSRRTDDAQTKRFFRARSFANVATGHGNSPAEALEGFKPDVVHLHNTFPNFSTDWLDRWGHRTVATLHNYRTVCAAGTLFRDGSECHECLVRPVSPAIRHRCYHDSALQSVPVAIATGPRGSLRSILTSAKELVALNGASADVFEQVAGRRPTVIPNFTVTAAPQDAADTYVYIGRLSSEKGILELLNAWPDSKRLEVIGDGPLRDRVLHAAGGRRNVSLRGSLHRQTLLGELAAHRALLIPSLWAEGLPTVLLEALARGVPSIISPSVAVGPDFANRGAAVRLPQNVPTQSDLLEAMQAVESGGAAMRSACLQLHEERYSPRAWLTAMQEIYDRVSPSPRAAK